MPLSENQPALVICDHHRYLAFSMLSVRPAISDWRAAPDSVGKTWAWTTLGQVALGLSIDDWRKVQERLRGLRLHALQPKQRVHLYQDRVGPSAQAISDIPFGGRLARIAWTLHRRILCLRSSFLSVADTLLADAIWENPEERPRHWRQTLQALLRALKCLHCADIVTPATLPPFGTASRLLSGVSDMWRDKDDICPGNCGAKPGTRHSHFQIDVGHGFLGMLEQLAVSRDGDQRGYDWWVRPPVKTQPSLRLLGKSGRIVSIFVPAILGSSVHCQLLNARQHRLLQSLVRETTRSRSTRTDLVKVAATVQGNLVRDYSGRKSTACPVLSNEGGYCGFNGNGKRAGLGYRLGGSGGWAKRAGYAETDMVAFVEDLADLARVLGLVVVGIGPGNRYFTAGQIAGLAATTRNGGHLDRIYLRVYTKADYLDRWANIFGFACDQPEETDNLTSLADVHVALASKKMSIRELARRTKYDASFLAKVLRQAKPAPAGMISRLMDAIVAITKNKRHHHPAAPLPKINQRMTKSAALAAVARGWSVLPQVPETKKPFVKWKPYQEHAAERETVASWFGEWPHAGLALVLGPVSGVFAIDVDGPDAHEALLRHLGHEPKAPKTISGSGKPFRYHLLFQHPDVSTAAKYTPWHDQLEFRGHRGLVVLPPSRHVSGNLYRWAKGQSPDDIELPPVPEPIMIALRERLRKPSHHSEPQRRSEGIYSKSTQDFLAGHYAEGPSWNEKAFKAACDLHAHHVSLKVAEKLILAGGKPRTVDDEETLRRTVQSAYSAQRTPSDT